MCINDDVYLSIWQLFSNKVFKDFVHLLELHLWKFEILPGRPDVYFKINAPLFDITYIFSRSCFSVHVHVRKCVCVFHCLSLFSVYCSSSLCSALVFLVYYLPLYAQYVIYIERKKEKKKKYKGMRNYVNFCVIGKKTILKKIDIKKRIKAQQAKRKKLTIYSPIKIIAFHTRAFLSREWLFHGGSNNNNIMIGWLWRHFWYIDKAI